MDVAVGRILSTKSFSSSSSGGSGPGAISATGDEGDTTSSE